MLIKNLLLSGHFECKMHQTAVYPCRLDYRFHSFTFQLAWLVPLIYKIQCEFHTVLLSCVIDFLYISKLLMYCTTVHMSLWHGAQLSTSTTFLLPLPLLFHCNSILSPLFRTQYMISNWSVTLKSTLMIHNNFIYIWS